MPSPFKQLRDLADSIGFESQPIDRMVDPARRLERTFEPEFPLRVRLFSFPDAERMLGDGWQNWHEHYELILPLWGEGVFHSGSHDIPYQPGDLLVVDGLQVHGMVALSGEHRSIVIHFQPGLVSGVGSAECDAVYLWPFTRRLPGKLPVVRGNTPFGERVHQAVLDLLRIFSSGETAGDPVTQARGKLQLLSLLDSVRDAFGLEATTVGRGGRWEVNQAKVKSALVFLRAHYPEKILLSDAARQVGMSLSNFKAVFSDVAGMSFGEALIRIRVEEAARLLRENDETIAAIAQAVGFSDQSHLTKRFRSVLRQTPGAYRRAWKLRRRSGGGG